MKYKILLLSLLLLNIFSNKALAVSAFPYPITIKQTDSTEITIRLVGDEFFHYTQTTDGLLIQRNDKDIFEYLDLSSDGTLVLTGIKASDVTKRKNKEIKFVKSLGEKKVKEKWINQHKKTSTHTEDRISKMTMLNTSSPLTGTKKVLCILIGYQDYPFTKTQSNFNNLMNQTGYNSIGSVKDFYKENSYNQLNLDITVVGPYTADNGRAYYGANDANGYDINPQALITEALQKANPDVNYADFDNDGDGIVDVVHVIFAGYDESDGGSEYAIWSHRWTIPTITLDGKSITDYSCSSELRGSSGNNICGIGTACHEMGHIFGASDFYDTNEQKVNDGDYEGTGNWDLMASGNRNGNGDRPAHFNPYTKTQTFQWATLQNITSDNVITLYPANSNGNSFYRLNTFTTGEYFLIENRQKLGFDAGLPGDGMLVYHVHSLFNGSSQINNITHPQRFYPICASATQNPNSSVDSYGDINNTGCPFPGSSNKTSLTRQTVPGLISWAGNGSGFDFQSIHKSGSNIIFDVNTYFSISGPTQVCPGEDMTFTITNFPDGATVVWNQDNPFTRVSLQGLDSCTFTSSVVSSGAIYAYLTYNGISFSLMKVVNVGSGYYNSNDFTIQVYETSTGHLINSEGPECLCENQTYDIMVVNNGYSQVSNYNWSLPSYWTINSSNGNTIQINTGSNTEGSIDVTTTNPCGYEENLAGTYLLPGFYCNGGYGFSYSLSPNPASNAVTINMDQTEARNSSAFASIPTNTKDETAFYSVKVIDSYSTIVYSGIKKGKQFTIPTASLRNGVYIIIVSNENKSYQRKLIVQH